MHPTDSYRTITISALYDSYKEHAETCVKLQGKCLGPQSLTALVQQVCQFLWVAYLHFNSFEQKYIAFGEYFFLL